MTRSTQDQTEESFQKRNNMEILLHANSTSLIAVDKNAARRLDLTQKQQNAIINLIKKKCPTCYLCKGVARVSNTGFIYETPTQPVPDTCPAKGETVTV